MTSRGFEEKDKEMKSAGGAVSKYTRPHNGTGAILLPELGLTPSASYELIRSFLASGRLVN